MHKRITLLMFLMVMPAFATDPDIPISTTSVACDDSALNSDTGPVNIEIEWEPNTINLRWYNNNTLMSGTGVQTTCTYDDSLTPPSTIPTREGYTFRGWRVRPEMDIRNLGSSMTYQQGFVKSSTFCRYLPSSGSFSLQACSNVNYHDLEPNEWKVITDLGTVYGMSKISSIQGSSAERTNTLTEPNGDTGYCWCKVTGFIPTGENTLYAPMHNMPWVAVDYTADIGNCTYYCMLRFRQRIVFRTNLFKPL